MMRWILNLMNKAPISEQTRADLEAIYWIDHARRSTGFRGKRGAGYAKSFFMRRILPWIVLFSIFMSINLIDDVSRDEIGHRGSFITYALVYVFLAIMFEMYVGFTLHALPRKQLKPTPVPASSIVLYEHLRCLVYRLKISVIAGIFLLGLLLKYYPGEYGTHQLIYFFFKLVAVTFIVNTAIVGFFGFFSNHSPRTRQRYIASITVPVIFMVLVILQFGVIFFDSISRDDFDATVQYMQRGFPAIWLTFFFHRSAASALTDYDSPLHSAAFIVFGLVLAAALEYVRLRLRMRVKHEGFSRPDYLVSYNRKRMEKWKAWREKKEKKKKGRTARKAARREERKLLRMRQDPHRWQYEQGSQGELGSQGSGIGKEKVFGKGIHAFFYKDERRPLWNKAKDDLKMAVVMYVLFLMLFYLLYYMMSICVIFLLMLIGALLLDEFLGMNPFDSTSFLRMVPEKPEHMVSIYLGKLWIPFVKAYYIFALVLTILVVIPLDMVIPSDVADPGSAFEPDVEFALIISTILPLHTLGLRMMGQAGMGVDKQSKKASNRWGWFFFLFFILDLVYLVALRGKFDFLGRSDLAPAEPAFAGIMLSWSFHMAAGAVMLFAAFHMFRAGAMDYFHNNRISSGYVPEPPTYSRDRTVGRCAAALAIILMTAFVFFPVSLEYDEGMFGPPEKVEFGRGPIPYDNALIYNEDTVIHNEELLPEQSIIVSNCTVKIYDSVINFTNERKGKFGLYVLEDARLEICNSTLTSHSYFKFEVYGDMMVKDSRISRLWGDRDNEGYDGGLEIYSKTKSHEVVIENTTIFHCRTNGIMIGRSSPSIFNCTFYDIRDDAIEMTKSRARIENCTIHNCTSGINMRDSKPLIANCTIHYIDDSAITQDDDSDPVMKNNFIVEPDRKGIDDYIDTALLNVILIAAAVCIVRPWRTHALLKECERECRMKTDEGG